MRSVLAAIGLVVLLGVVVLQYSLDMSCAMYSSYPARSPGHLPHPLARSYTP